MSYISESLFDVQEIKITRGYLGKTETNTCRISIGFDVNLFEGGEVYKVRYKKEIDLYLDDEFDFHQLEGIASR